MNVKELREILSKFDDEMEVVFAGNGEYRTEVAGVLARRAALIAYQRAGGKS